MLVQMIGSIFGIVRMRIIYLTMYQKTGYELSDRAGCLRFSLRFVVIEGKLVSTLLWL